jgi:hypothetical protein
VARTLRAFERKQLEQKLKDDKHAAQVASATLGQIGHQIDVKRIGLGFLDNRTERFVKSALVEVARPYPTFVKAQGSWVRPQACLMPHARPSTFLSTTSLSDAGQASELR